MTNKENGGVSTRFSNESGRLTERYYVNRHLRIRTDYEELKKTIRDAIRALGLEGVVYDAQGTAYRDHENYPPRMEPVWVHEWKGENGEKPVKGLSVIIRGDGPVQTYIHRTMGDLGIKRDEKSNITSLKSEKNIQSYTVGKYDEKQVESYGSPYRKAIKELIEKLQSIGTTKLGTTGAISFFDESDQKSKRAVVFTPFSGSQMQIQIYDDGEMQTATRKCIQHFGLNPSDELDGLQIYYAPGTPEIFALGGFTSLKSHINTLASLAKLQQKKSNKDKTIYETQEGTPVITVEEKAFLHFTGKTGEAKKCLTVTLSKVKGFEFLLGLLQDRMNSHRPPENTGWKTTNDGIKTTHEINFVQQE